MTNSSNVRVIPWLKQWFYDKDNEMNDTGWTSFPYREVSYPVKIVPVDGGSMYEVTDAPSWQSVTGSTSTTFMKDYSSSQQVRVRRIGKVVHIEGTMTTDIKVNNEFPLKGLACGEANATTYTGDYYVTVGKLSEEFRPSSNVYTVQQSSSMNRFLLIVLPNGNVRIGRYGTTSYINPPFNTGGTGPGFDFYVTYTVGEDW